jgi:hypothetical protein
MRMRTERVQVLLEPEERERFARAADRCGESLSSWLRRAGRERLERLQRRGAMSASELESFFAACNARDDGTTEPDWDEHQRVMDRSRSRGASET